MAIRGDERCFGNPHLKDDSCKLSKKKGAASSDEIPSELLEQLKDEIASNLPRLDSAYSPQSQDQSIYTGSAGVALLHLHLATSLHTDNPTESARHLHTALSLLTPSLSHLSTRRTTFLCGAAGPLSVAAIVHAHLGNSAEAKECVQRLKALYTENKASFSALPSEMLFGHAGYLYALLLVKAYIPSAVEEALIVEVASVLLDAGERGRREGCPLMYTWHDKHYLGAAHGLAGILTLLLQFPSSSSLWPRLLSLVQPCVDWLCGVQFPSGNFPSSLESSGRDRLVHWCHGAPGIVHLLAHAHRVFGEERYLRAAERCGEVVWERGLLRKGYGLCHGVAGNGYTFLQLYRLTGRQEYVCRAIKFAEWCLTSTSSKRQCGTPDRPFSLFEGLAGTTFFYVDLLRQLENSRFPGLELPVVASPLALE